MLDLGVVGLVFFEVFVPADVDWPQQGEENFVDRLPVGLGGALNTASVAKALGARVALISPRGDGLTDLMIRAAVQRLGVEDHPWPGPPDPGITLVRSTPHDRAFISAIAPGAPARLSVPPKRPPKRPSRSDCPGLLALSPGPARGGPATNGGLPARKRAESEGEVPWVSRLRSPAPRAMSAGKC